MIVVRAPSSLSRRTTGRPRNPTPPVTATALPLQNCAPGSATAAAHVAALKPILERLHVRLDHDAHELLESHLGRPPEPLLGLRRVAAERVDLRRTVVLWIDLD